MELETPLCPWDLFLPFSLFAFFSFSLFVKILNTPKKLQKKKNFHKNPIPRFKYIGEILDFGGKIVAYFKAFILLNSCFNVEKFFHC